MIDYEILKNDIQNLLQFTCENKLIKSDYIIKSTINMFKKCPSSRQAVLVFYSNLFDDIIQKFIDEHNSIKTPRVYIILSKLFQANYEANYEANRVIKERKSNETLPNNSADTSITPMSPPMMDCQADIKEENDELNMNEAIDEFILWIETALIELIQDKEFNNYQMIIDWALMFISNLSSKYSIQGLFQSSNTNPTFVFSESIKFWIKCPVINLLLKLIMVPSSESQLAVNYESILKKLIDYSPGSDWICAYLITSLPSNSNSSLFSICIHSLLQSKASQTSITNILSYISEHNPQAIITASQSNIPFLLRLCANSKPLLNLLALEAVKQVDINRLNEMSTTLTEDLRTPTIYCVLNATNAYDLLLLIFDACSHHDANDTVKTQAFSILTSIISHIHGLVYSTSNEDNFSMLEILKSNSDHLILQTINQSNNNLKRLQFRIVQLLCLHFGLSFTSKVFHQILNCLNVPNELSLLPNPPNPILVNLIKCLKLPFGTKVYSYFEEAVRDSAPKEAKFWANLLALAESDGSFEIDIDLLSLKFCEYLQAHSLDRKIYYTLKLTLVAVDKTPKLVNRPKHHLCISLMCAYMKVLKLLEQDDNDIELRMQIITTAQKLMSHLSKGQTANQHILFRTLLETEMQYNEMEKSNSNCDRSVSHVSLLKENLQYSNASKFRKISLNAKKRENNNYKESNNGKSFLRQQLLVDAIRCSIVDTPSFANLLVECITPDVMFNDKPWPDEDFLKVTIEKDLFIAKKFETNPVLWDFCELIAKANCLHFCAVLIRALMAVQLTRWSSAIACKDKLDSTQRLVSLIASSELVPSVPFKYIPQILPSLTPWEIFCVLNDLWRYIRDNNQPNVRSSELSLRPYLERLRIITSQKIQGPWFVKMFKGIN